MNISSHNSPNFITFVFFHVLELPLFCPPTSIFNAQLLSSQNVPLVPTKTTPSAGGDFDGADGSTVGAFQGQCHGDAWHRHCNLVLRWPDDERILRFGLPENLGKGWWKVGGPNKTEELFSYMRYFFGCRGWKMMKLTQHRLKAVVIWLLACLDGRSLTFSTEVQK